MGNYNHYNRSSSRSNFGSREDREMHQAVCSSCGKNCSLPFKPNGRKPVYCSDCFQKNGGGDDSRSFQDRRPSFHKRPDYGNRPDFKPQNNEQFEMINRKLDKISEMLKASLSHSTPLSTD